MMRRISALLLLLVVSGTLYSRSNEMSLLLARLDSVLANSGKYVLEKEERIEELQGKRASALKLEDKLWINKMLYDEYFVYNADSAMAYVDDNIEIAG